MRNVETNLLPMGRVSEENAELFAQWMELQKQSTNFDRSVIGYPRACMFEVQKSEKTIAMVPVHTVFALESLARDPNLTDSELVLALDSIDKKVQQAMRDSGIAEAFFQTNIERFADICERHGWVKVMFDPEKHEWLMKKRARIDWVKLLEANNASNDQPDVKS
jgi:hypothetical protein